MSFEKFVHRNRLTSDLLDRIAASTDADRLFAHTDAVDPRVRALVAAQERLLSAAEKLLEHCGGQGHRPN
jgi:hypothetical protein